MSTHPPTRRTRAVRHLVVVLAVCALVAATLINGSAPARAEPKLPPNQPEHGLIYDGLEQPDQSQRPDDSCKNMYRVKGTKLCTHGPDPIPGNKPIAFSPAPAALAAAASTVVCFGDGTSGPRTQVVYARASDRPDRYAAYLASIQQWAAEADQIYHNSASETGGSRHIRFVHTPGCVPTVVNAVMPPTGDDNFSNTVSALGALGYNRSDRKYMVFVDANVYCGIGGILGDDSPGGSNANNGGPSYGRTDAGCWSSDVAAHEHMHNLGGVQLSAPHTSGGWHCVDEYDLMCYSDSPYYPPMIYSCPSSAHDLLFDCNHDDYYSTRPAAGGYLASHWNAADSRYLFTPSFVHVATAATITSHRTAIDHPATNGNPNALLTVTPNWNPGGVGGTYNNHATGVWYNAGAGKWEIFNQDFAAMPTSAAFNIEVGSASPTLFVHTATAANTSGHVTFIDHPALNANPAARILVTANWNPGGVGGVYLKANLGVYYTGSRWAIFSQGFEGITGSAAFNVKILSTGAAVFTHTATAANSSGNVTYIDNPATNGNPQAIVQVTQNWNPGGAGGTYNNSPIGVWYNSSAGKWSVFNQNIAAMPAGAAFNVEVLQP